MLATRNSSTTPIPGLPPPILPPPSNPFGSEPDPNGPPDCPCGVIETGSSDGDVLTNLWTCNPCPDWGGGFGLGPSGGPMPVGPDTGGGAVAPPGTFGGGGIAHGQPILLPVLHPPSDPTPEERCDNAIKTIASLIHGLNFITQTSKFFPEVKIAITAIDLLSNFTGFIKDYTDRANYLENVVGLASLIVGICLKLVRILQ